MDNSNHCAALFLAICYSTYWKSGTQPCLHSHTIPPVSHHSCGPPELRNTTERAQVTEGAKLKLLLFGQKWNQHHLSELVTSQLPCKNLYTETRKAKVAIQCGFIELHPRKERGQM